MPNESNPDAWEGIVKLPWYDDVLHMLAVHRFVNLVGEPCTGKTTFAMAAAMRLSGELPVILAGSPEIELAQMFGSYQLKQEETPFVDGALPLSLKSKRWLLIEEAALIPMDVRAALLTLRGASSITNPLNAERIQIPPASQDNYDFRVVLTSNPESMRCHRGAAVSIARALYDDVLTMEVPAMSTTDVVAFLRHNHPLADSYRIHRVVELWEDFRRIRSKTSSGDSEGYLTYRACSQVLKLLERGMREDVAIRVGFVTKFVVDDDLYAAAKLKAEIG
ncbi:MAG: AAA family ATPase [Pirellulaceae bacterium]